MSEEGDEGDVSASAFSILADRLRNLPDSVENEDVDLAALRLAVASSSAYCELHYAKGKKNDLGTDDKRDLYFVLHAFTLLVADMGSFLSFKQKDKKGRGQATVWNVSVLKRSDLLHALRNHPRFGNKEFSNLCFPRKCNAVTNALKNYWKEEAGGGVDGVQIAQEVSALLEKQMSAGKGDEYTWLCLSLKHEFRVLVPPPPPKVPTVVRKARPSIHTYTHLHTHTHTHMLAHT